MWWRRSTPSLAWWQRWWLLRRAHYSRHTGTELLAGHNTRNDLTHLADAATGTQRKSQILAAVGGRQHDAQACSIARYGGEGHRLHENPGVEQLRAQNLGALGVADHDRRDRGLRTPQVKAEG